MVIQRLFEEVLMVFKEIAKCVSRKFECFNDVYCSRMDLIVATRTEGGFVFKPFH